MQFEIFGGFEVYRNEHGSIPREASARREFWEDVENTAAGIQDACGCYLFSINSTPWYVGKAEKSSFREECFTPHKINCYKDALDGFEKCTPKLYFVALMTPRGRFAKPGSSGNSSIRFLERWLIGQALNRNPELCNIKDTKFLKEMIVPGLLNSRKGSPTSSQRNLRRIIMGR